MSKDRAEDKNRVPEYEESRNEYFERKFGEELAYPKPDTHEEEREAANKRLPEEN